MATQSIKTPGPVAQHDPINVCLYGASSGVIDLGNPPPHEIIPILDLRTNSTYKVNLLNVPATSIIGTAFASACTGLDFANQPAGDSVTVRTSSASDVGKTVTMYATTTSTSVVAVGTKTIAAANTDEDLTLSDGTAKTNWGTALGFEIDSAAVGTITFKEKSGLATIITISATGTASGVTAVAAGSQNGYCLPVQAVCSGSGTKLVGAVGTNPAGTAVYDAITLNGTTAVNGRVGMATVTKLLHGDLEAARTATFSIGNLNWQAGPDVLENVGAGDDGVGRRIQHRYLYWCCCTSTGTTVTAAGEHDWLHIKRF